MIAGKRIVLIDASLNGMAVVKTTKLLLSEKTLSAKAVKLVLLGQPAVSSVDGIQSSSEGTSPVAILASSFEEVPGDESDEVKTEASRTSKIDSQDALGKLQISTPVIDMTDYARMLIEYRLPFVCYDFEIN